MGREGKENQLTMKTPKTVSASSSDLPTRPRKRYSPEGALREIQRENSQENNELSTRSEQNNIGLLHQCESHSQHREKCSQSVGHTSRKSLEFGRNNSQSKRKSSLSSQSRSNKKVNINEDSTLSKESKISGRFVQDVRTNFGDSFGSRSSVNSKMHKSPMHSKITHTGHGNINHNEYIFNSQGSHSDEYSGCNPAEIQSSQERWAYELISTTFQDSMRLLENCEVATEERINEATKQLDERIEPTTKDLEEGSENLSDESEQVDEETEKNCKKMTENFEQSNEETSEQLELNIKEKGSNGTTKRLEEDEEAVEEFEPRTEETIEEPKDLRDRDAIEKLLEEHCRAVSSWVKDYLPHLKTRNENILNEAKSVVLLLCSSKLGFAAALFRMIKFVVCIIKHFLKTEELLEELLDFVHDIFKERENSGRSIDEEELDKWLCVIDNITEELIGIDGVESRKKSLKIAELYADVGKWCVNFPISESCFEGVIKAKVEYTRRKATKELHRVFGENRKSESPIYARICFNMSVAHLRSKEYKEADTYCKYAVEALFKVFPDRLPEQNNNFCTQVANLRNEINMHIT